MNFRKRKLQELGSQLEMANTADAQASDVLTSVKHFFYPSSSEVKYQKQHANNEMGIC